MSRIRIPTQPAQRLTYRQKTKDWRQSNVDFGDTHSLYHSESVRKSLKNKIINLNLYNGIVNIKDLVDIVNPYHMDASYIPDNIPHHPILVPKIDLLVGEDLKRRFDFYCMVINSDAITAKEEAKKKALFQKLSEYLQANYEEEELEAKFKELEEYMKYSWQDIREKMANQILRHYYEEQDFKSIFNNGFKDALLMAEEIYQVEIVHDEPILTKLNPLKLRTVRSGNSDRIEDASVIIIEDHWAPGKIIDYFHDQLKNEDIEYITEGKTGSKGSYTIDNENHVLLQDSGEFAQESVEAMFNYAELNGHYFSSNYTDDVGNIRVLRVYWRSLKKIKKVKYYDNFGSVEYKIRSEDYILDEMRGEEATDMWVNEWWEGTKIGKDIYINMRPRPVQYNKINNPSICHPGIIGQIYNTNQGQAVSLVDRCKNHQYTYDVMWDRLNKAISTNYGKIFELDLSKVPDNWEIEKWLHFAVVNKIAVVDSFKEGKQGASTGKLAGGLNNTSGGRAIDMETGNYIQQHIQFLEFIKTEMGEIAGVTKQREGAIHQNETASGVERSVNQSSHTTEYWFHKHEKVKIRVLSAFLETAKIALRGNNKKVQHILDDQTIQMLNIDGNEFSEADYGIVCTSSSKAQELEQSLKQYAQAFLQNGGSLTSIMDIYFSPSLSDMRRKLEIAEDKMVEQQNRSQDAANKLAQEAQQNAIALEQSKLQLDELKNQRDNQTKIYIAELSHSMQPEIEENDGIEEAKLGLDKEKVLNDKMLKIRKLNDDMTMHRDKMEKEDKKIAVSRTKSVSK